MSPLVSHSLSSPSLTLAVWPSEVRRSLLYFLEFPPSAVSLFFFISSPAFAISEMDSVDFLLSSPHLLVVRGHTIRVSLGLHSRSLSVRGPTISCMSPWVSLSCRQGSSNFLHVSLGLPLVLLSAGIKQSPSCLPGSPSRSLVDRDQAISFLSPYVSLSLSCRQGSS